MLLGIVTAGNTSTRPGRFSLLSSEALAKHVELLAHVAPPVLVG